MSYAIIRNEKLTRAESYGAYVHNDRKAKNHSNKDIDPTRTHLNFYCKENETTYIREFDRMKKEYDLQGNAIDKICARDFWRGRDSYRKLQNDFHKYVTSKGFDLERGLPVEETGVKHYKIEDLKKITNFENTKKVLRNINLELPDVPELADISKFSIKKDEKILEEIIKPKDNIIKELYNDNLALHRELSKQSRVIKEAEKYQKERDIIIADNKELNNRVKELENEYKEKNNNLDFKFDNRKREPEKEFQEKTYDIEYEYKSKVRKLEKENSKLHRIIDKFYETIDKFIHWICEKFDMGAEDNLIRDFQKETNTFLDPEKQIKIVLTRNI